MDAVLNPNIVDIIASQHQLNERKMENRESARSYVRTMIGTFDFTVADVFDDIKSPGDRTRPISICREIMLQNPQITLQAFVTQAMERGVLEVTARTQYSRCRKWLEENTQ